MPFTGLIALAAMLALSGCTTTRLTEPGQTAQQELLVSTAIDHAVEQLNPNIPSGTKVFVDPQFFDTGDPTSYTKYAVASIRDKLLRQGLKLMDDRKAADMVIELRTGGESIDHHDTLLGLPAIPVPVPFAGTLVTPKVAIWERDKQTGVAKIALTAYDKDGALTTSTDATYGLSKQEHWVVLIVVSGDKTDLLPKGLKE